jgi:outer membrane receptor for ferrienterochelin and colicin
MLPSIAIALPASVVTAQKRTENLSSVPAAISVVSAAQLQAAGINNAESLQDIVPSLTFKKGTTNLNSTLSVRGIGSLVLVNGSVTTSLTNAGTVRTSLINYDIDQTPLARRAMCTDISE